MRSRISSVIRMEPSLTRTIVKVTILLLTITFNTSLESTNKCEHDIDCPKNTDQFCQGTICHECINCQSFHRNTGLRTSCLRDQTECGSCIDGYREVINGHPPYGKQCMVRRSNPLQIGSFGVDVRPRNSKEAPSSSAEIGITIGVVIVGAAIVVAIMAAVYYNLRQRRLLAIGQRDQFEKPHLIQMSTFPIADTNQQLIRRQESDDELKAISTEISPINNEQFNTNINNVEVEKAEEEINK